MSKVLTNNGRVLNKYGTLTNNGNIQPTLPIRFDKGWTNNLYDNYANNSDDEDTTVLLMHMDGTDGSTNFIDSTGRHSITANADAQIDTAQKVFGTGSAYFDGNGDYLSIPDSTDWDFGNGDFTMDCHIRFSSVLADAGIIDQFFDVRAFRWNYSTTKGMQFLYSTNGSTVTKEINRSWSPLTDTWYHIAVVRAGSNLSLYVNGTRLGSSQNISSDTFYDSTVPLFIGAEHSGAGGNTPDWELNGWIDELRIVKGTAVWTENFTPPTRAYYTG